MVKKHKPPPRDSSADDQNDDAPEQARPFWSGVITFGLVSLPVSLFPANRGKPIALTMVDLEGLPLRRRYVCEQEQTLLEQDDLVRGYPAGDDHFVVIEDDELEALAPEKTREIDLRWFVPLDDISPVFFERGYFLAPDSGVTKAYRLLAQSMEQQQRAGIATFVMRDREYIIAIIAEKGILRAETLRFYDEIRTPEQVGLPALVTPKAAHLQPIEKAINARSDSAFDSRELTEQEVQRLRALVESKLEAGTDIVAEPEVTAADEESNVVDLIQVLKERLQGQKEPSDRTDMAG